MEKPIHVKPSLYAYYFYGLKEIALKYGYNLVIHGSMNRDLDLVAIPWQEKVGDCDEMVEEFCDYLGGRRIVHDCKDGKDIYYNYLPQRRRGYVINLNRRDKDGNDLQYYVDISVTPSSREIIVFSPDGKELGITN